MYEHEHYLTVLNGKQVTLLMDSIAKNSVAIEIPGVAIVNFSLVGTVSYWGVFWLSPHF